jgi:hypothetical protein
MKKLAVFGPLLIGALAFADIRPLTWGPNGIALPDGSVVVLADAGASVGVGAAGRSDPIPLCTPNSASCGVSLGLQAQLCCGGSLGVYLDGGCPDGGAGSCTNLDGGPAGSQNVTAQLEGSIDQKNWFAYPNTSQTLSALNGGSACESWIQTQGVEMPFSAVQITGASSDGGFCWGASSTW